MPTRHGHFVQGLWHTPMISKIFSFETCYFYESTFVFKSGLRRKELGAKYDFARILDLKTEHIYA